MKVPAKGRAAQMTAAGAPRWPGCRDRGQEGARVPLGRAQSWLRGARQEAWEGVHACSLGPLGSQWEHPGSIQKGGLSGTDSDYGHGSLSGTRIRSFCVEWQEVWGSLGMAWGGLLSTRRERFQCCNNLYGCRGKYRRMSAQSVCARTLAHTHRHRRWPCHPRRAQSIPSCEGTWIISSD